MSELKYAVWLQQALGEGGALPAQVLRQFSSFRDFYEAGPQEWRLCGLFHLKQLDKLERTSLKNAEKILYRCETLGQTVLSLELWLAHGTQRRPEFGSPWNFAVRWQSRAW